MNSCTFESYKPGQYGKGASKRSVLRHLLSDIDEDHPLIDILRELPTEDSSEVYEALEVLNEETPADRYWTTCGEEVHLIDLGEDDSP